VAAYIRALQLSQNAKPGDVPAGQHPVDLHEIAKTQGMPPGFADDWANELPATAVHASPEGKTFVLPTPGMSGTTTEGKK
jgi:hypothetical protein